MDEQISRIILCLIDNEKMTAYKVSRETSISIPQVQYKIDKLVNAGMVNLSVENNRTVYDIHPALKNKKAIAKVTKHIKKIVDIIDKEQMTRIEGMKLMIDFIASRTQIEK